MPIQQLDPQTVDQIAAGEVLERPSNLIKELVENSLDAGASQIEIHLARGGKEISVIDNGSGIEAAELPLALERFATSKIHSFDDLFRLGTFGFRGEALASASAVSHLKLISRAKNASRAAGVISRFGKSEELPEAPRAPGTTVQIESLFENVPARLKFLKSDTQEISQIKRTLKALALVHWSVEFLIRLEGELVLHWPARTEWSLRVQDILLVRAPLIADVHEAGWQMQACFTNPNETQKTSQNIWLFVNDRWVQDRSLQQAVMEAYRNLLMHGEWPTAVVRLIVPPDQVDVNVHPSKSQVKFLDQRTAFRIVHHGIRNILEKSPWVESIVSSPVRDFVPEPVATQIQISDWMGAGQARPSVFPANEDSVQPMQLQRESTFQRPVSETEALLVNSLTENLAAAPKVMSTKISAVDFEPKWGSLEVLGQANATYILAQSPHGIVLIDQHAAHERVAFERLMNGWRTKCPDVQSFLIPLSVEMEESLIEGLLSQRPRLAELGVEIEQGGPGAVFVNSCPVIVKESAVIEMLGRLARDIQDQGESFQFERMVSEIFASMACHSVVRAGKALSIPEMKSLLEQMDEFSLSSFCPHGRPVFVEYPFRELEKDFGRLV